MRTSNQVNPRRHWGPLYANGTRKYDLGLPSSELILDRGVYKERKERTSCI
ncbi:hypothetical protein COCNU_06G005040 [Cocos nucifera]|uniref:Uncharacterized protein n=1 Tax=Cocos nucifera TaxID=13894 RepID=A0A8K0N2L1_COCNU|nr:hypothetical protein COCNU_06G005040 [Cocos nucifera]